MLEIDKFQMSSVGISSYINLKCNTYKVCQWRIQDFPDRGAPTPRVGEGANLLFGQFSPKIAWKRKHLGRQGPLDPPARVPNHYSTSGTNVILGANNPAYNSIRGISIPGRGAHHWRTTDRIPLRRHIHCRWILLLLPLRPLQMESSRNG